VGLAVAAALAFALLLEVAWPAVAWAQPEPVIRAGDELRVVIPEARGAEEQTLVVDSAGQISLGVYGRVTVAGQTEGEARETLIAHLTRYIRRTADIEVELLRRQRLLLVTGQVATPGLTLVEGAPHPWIAIEAAGGLLPGADLGHVLLFRNGEQIPIDIRGYLTRENTEPLPEVLSGDTLFVPAEPGLPAVEGSETVFLSDASLRSKVFVLGAVASPGVYDRMPGLNPLTALALAGGPAEGADLSNVRVISPEQSERIDLESWLLGESVGWDLFPEGVGVIMYVPTRPGATDPFARTAYLMGRTGTQGPVGLSGPTRLVDLLGTAGGFAADADLEEVFIIRQGERFSLALHYDLEEYFRSGGVLGSVWVYPGDVLFIDALPDTTLWQDFVGLVRDLALVSGAVLLWVNLLQGSE
jgi:protein involved in polysaccharide export with SLBB domain